MKIDLAPRRRRPSFGRHRIFRGIKRGLLGLATVTVLVGTPVFFHYYDYPFAAAELPEAVRAYRAAGLPWTAKDVAPPHVAEKDNAASLIHTAIVAMPKGHALLLYDKAVLDGQTAAPLPEFSSALRFAHLAARRPALDFARDWDLGPMLVFPEPSQVKSFCRLLAGRAEYRALRGGDVDALADLDDARRLAALIGSEPTIISALVGAACDTIVSQAAGRCLVHAGASPARLTAYRAWIASANPLPDLKRAFRGQIYETVTTVRNFDHMGIGLGPNPIDDWRPFSDAASDGEGNHHHDFVLSRVRRDGVPGPLRARAYMARCLQMWTETAQRTDNLNDPLEAVAARSGEIEDRAESLGTWSHWFDAILFPIFNQFPRGNRVASANRAVTLAFADALILHARTGRWPKAVRTLDPMGTGPLHVQFDGTRFRVWSVGRNGKDDGGFFKRETTGSRDSDDIVAAFPPVRTIPFRPKPRSSIPAD